MKFARILCVCVKSAQISYNGHDFYDICLLLPMLKSRIIMHVSCIKQINIFNTELYYYILQLQCNTNLLIIPDQ